MSRAQKWITAFWIFIGSMLLWQFYSYNEGLKQQAIEHPQQTEFWFTNAPPNKAAAPTQAAISGADVQQTAFVVQDNTPSTGSFTCQVTLKNMGKTKAVSVQISVRPYRGVSNYDEDVGQQHIIVLSDDDPISKFGQWVTFPDLAPGESSTQSVTFLSRSDFKPGSNPKPDIMFQTEKAPPKPAN